MSSKIAVLQALRSKIHGIECTAEERPRTYVASSFPELDRALPGGGLPLGTLVEVLTERDGSGALSLALKLAQAAVTQRPAWAVVDTDHSFYPLAAALAGLNLENLIVVRPEPRRAGWAFTQLLRSPSIGVSFLASRSMDNMTFRRFQLAAERGGGLAFIVRPMEAMKKPCWASLRLKIQRVGFEQTAKLRFTLLHVRNGNFTEPVCMDLDA
jgi:hypothetical protein